MVLERLTFGYGKAPLLRDLSLAVAPGQLLALLGPSGCGKTTLLKLIGGYLTPSSGRVILRGRDVTAMPPERRNAGMVFQNYALFPHLSASENVAFGLRVRGVPRQEREKRVEAMLDLVGLSAAERGRRPAALSGGQQQRVALARALVYGPDVLLLDEPLANLDRQLRESMRAELRRLQRETRVTAVLVTHDQEEALAIADVVGVMSAGALLQVGTPEEVYQRPASAFVATFVGEANLLPGGRMVRPERCVIGAEAEGCALAWTATVRATAFLGSDARIETVSDNGMSLIIRTRHASARPGDRVRVGVPDAAIWTIPEGGA